jgi:hypothetical protein
MSAAPGIADPRDVVTFDLKKVTDMTYAFDSIRTEIYMVMFLLCLTGYFARIWQNRKEPQAHMAVIGHIGFLIMFAAALTPLKPVFQALFYYPAEKLADATPLFQINEVMNHFDKMMASQPQGGSSILDNLSKFTWNFVEMTRNAMVSAVFYGLFLIMSALASIIAMPFYFLQVTLVEVGFAFAPIAFGALAVPALKDKGSGYLCMLASIMAWPLGFCVVAAMANIVLAAFPAASGSAGFAFGPLIAGIVAAVIMLVGTVMVPATCLYIFLYGGTVFNPISAAASAIPIAGRAFSARGR